MQISPTYGAFGHTSTSYLAALDSSETNASYETFYDVCNELLNDSYSCGSHCSSLLSFHELDALPVLPDFFEFGDSIDTKPIKDTA